jgi:hypothetical protein
MFAAVGGFLGLPALRCAPCRHKFFSLRPLLPAERLAGVAAEDVSPKY